MYQVKHSSRYLFTPCVRVVALILCVVFLLGILPQASVHAISAEQRLIFQRGILNFDVEQASLCPLATATAGEGGTNTNTDYAGNEILVKAQLDAIDVNMDIYQQAANEEGVPWQMLAAIHLRENSLKKENPGENGEGFYDGIYQFRTGPYRGDASAEKYPPGPVNDGEFLNQTINAAKFLKDKARTSNYTPNRELTQNPTIAAVKDTFFSYNGRASPYKEQAKALGFTGPTEGYEGSPYVMNKADAQRDPEVAEEGTWGQFTGGEGLEYPAKDDYGAFVVYSALANIAIDGECHSSLRKRIIDLARQELELWDNGQLEPGSGYQKYSHGVEADWCAFFVSWIYDQAGFPLSNNSNGTVALVDVIKSIGEDTNNEAFSYHDVGSYTPKIGDIVIQKEGVSHTNIVVGVEEGSQGTLITVVGGNQGGTNGFNTSRVTEYTMPVDQSENTGFVSPNTE